MFTVYHGKKKKKALEMKVRHSVILFVPGSDSVF